MMKKEIYKIGLWLWVFLACGCDNFLEESSQDEVRPGTTNDLEQLLLGEGYLRDDYLTNYLDLLTDDIDNHYTEYSGYASILPGGASVFSWVADMYEQLAQDNMAGRDTWEKTYSKIKGCNVILDMLDEVDGNEKDKLNLRGQALAMRAFYYFTLVNLYGLPYNASGVDPANSPGVPLILESAVKDEFPVRASVAEVYAQVESDLLEAAPLMEKYGQQNYKMRVTDLFVHTLLSRLYLYMENWNQAILHADYVLQRKPGLLNLSDYVSVEEDWFGDETLTYDVVNGAVYHLNSPELIWGYSSRAEYSVYFAAPEIGTSPAYCVSENLRQLYENGDLRVEFFYQSYIVYMDWMTGTIIKAPNFGYKSPDESLAHPKKGMRVAEVYLNHAEANIQLYLKDGNIQARDVALKDLNFLRSHRFLAPYKEIKAEEVEDLLQFYREERRRELSFEDHRWYDLRRYGMPEISHTLTLTEGQPMEYRLSERDKRYVLPIAKVVLDRNPALQQNP